MHAPGTSPAHGLDEELQAANNLLQLLLQEQTTLVNADVDGLIKLTAEKAKLAAQMTQLAKRRHRALRDAGFEANDTGMQAWLASATAADNRAWNDLLTAMRSAKEHNRVNGLLIGQHMARNQGALNVLQGNAQGGPIYGPDGQATTKIGSRRLVVG
ncbi:flagella synthesis protein FlgN [Noviherbaspirillum sp. UKPF54]|uniref:flagella synthesis protein FlgN n=1 Tax=Noviherbaspirillum sp. UKPF54 TaxID=2601898 RepID=UPI0011B10771|nr:flagellar protein FlgN [Noviherbaspirillum sp. UKPF54]QDZ28132.1 flagellar protein FlgN [Noviherbaspirillum sp. UKPF54]